MLDSVIRNLSVNKYLHFLKTTKVFCLELGYCAGKCSNPEASLVSPRIAVKIIYMVIITSKGYMEKVVESQRSKVYT